MNPNEQYLAGFLDGEGTFCLPIRKSSPRRPRPSVYYYPWVAAYNTNRDALVEIQRRFGGSLHEMKSRSRPANCKVEYVLVWQNRAAERILHQVFPYLIVKKPQAKLLLQFAYYRKAIRSSSRSRLMPNDIEMRARFRDILQKLNRRGV